MEGTIETTPLSQKRKPRPGEEDRLAYSKPTVTVNVGHAIVGTRHSSESQRAPDFKKLPDIGGEGPTVDYMLMTTRR